ncbi:unnamed protein product [Polarella glacialis]|nr:unnamed protein product [Polarella glacialis]
MAVLSVGVFGAIGHGAAQPLVTVFFGDIINILGQEKDNMMEEISKMCVLMAVFGGVAIVCAAFQFMCFKYFGERMQKRMRVAYLDSVLHKDVGWFDMRQVASLPSQITGDIDNIAEAFSEKVSSSIMAVSCFMSGYILAFNAGWMLALVLLSILVLMALGLKFTGGAVREIRMKTQSWYAEAAATVEECLYSMRTVVAFGGEFRELAKFEAAIKEVQKNGVSNGLKGGIGLAWISTVLFAGYALAFGFGGWMRDNDIQNPTTGEVWQPGSIMTCFFCILIGAINLQNIAPGFKAMQGAKMSGGRFFGILETQSAIECSGSDGRKSLETIDHFELRNVHFYYPARPLIKVLDGICLSFKKGQKVAVVGESGSGKSTVMALLERFYDPQDGQVLIDGVDVRDYSVSTLRKAIGYVGQEPVLFATSIRENIMSGYPSATEKDLQQVCSEAQLTFVDSLPNKLDTFVGSGGSQFSGGQKQRIAIARALIKNASFLFLDEATSALDNASEKMIQDTLDHVSHARAGGLGIVSIAHRLSTVQNSDVIFVLSKGKVAEQGTHASLMDANGLYHALATAQQMSKSEHQKKEASQKAYSGDVTPQSQEGKDVATVGGATVRNSALEDVHEQEQERQKELLKTYKVPMRRLLTFCRPEWLYWIPALFGSAVDGCSMPVISFILTKAIVAFFLPKEQMMAKIQETCWIFLGIALANLIFVTGQHWAFAVLGEAMTARIRVAILKALFRQEMGFHDDPQNTPAMSARALEVYALRVTTFNRTFGVEVGALSCVACGLGLAFGYCWQMALVMLGSIPILMGALMLQRKTEEGSNKKENELLMLSQQIITDSVQNARTVHACGCEAELVQLYSGMLNSALKGLPKRAILGGCFFGFAAGIRFFVMSGGFYYGAVLINEGQTTFEAMLVAFMGVIFAGVGAGRCATMLGDGAKAKLAAHGIFSLIDRQSAIDGLEPSGSIPVLPTRYDAGRIEFENVQFHYPFRPQVKVLKGMSFTVSSGMSVGLVGPSGGGKSTVMALLQRFYDPMQGTVFIGSGRTPLKDVNIRWWRSQLGFVGQEPVLFNTSVRANVLYGLTDGETVSDEHLERCKKMANLSFLDENGGKGLDTEVGPRGAQLSGGQKQRVAICRALVRDPPLLLLDEATSALDTQSERVVQASLEAARAGRTCFAIAHRLSTISNCDIILVVGDGVVIEKGTHQELVALQGVYHKLQQQSH